MRNLLLVFFVFSLATSQAQTLGFTFPEGRKRADIPIQIHNNLVVVSVTINGTLPLKFIVDTGDRSAFTLYRKFSQKTHLDKIFTGKAEVLSGYGVGGPIPAQISTLQSISLGRGLQLNDVLSRLPNTKGGVFAQSDQGGSIGNEILKRFTVTFDYPHKKMVLVRNNLFAVPFQFIPVPNPAGASKATTN